MYRTLLQEVCRELRFRSATLNSTDMSQVLWSLAALEYADPELLGLLKSRLAEMWDDLSPHDSAVTVWGLATLGFDTWDLLLRLEARVAAGAVEGMNAASASLLLSGLVKSAALRFSDSLQLPQQGGSSGGGTLHSLLRVLSNELMEQVDQASLIDISRLCQAWTRLRYPATEQDLARLAARCQQLMQVESDLARSDPKLDRREFSSARLLPCHELRL